MRSHFKHLLNDVASCSFCASHLPLGPKPIIRISPSCTILIIGQAPGSRVHKSGIPWDDASGDRLRHWMGIDRTQFYTDNRIGIMPMGFCYPGKSSGGDLPPRPECAPLWHERILNFCTHIELILLIGQYAQAYYLKSQRKDSLTQTVKTFMEYAPTYIPLVHPSPRNQLWLKKNPWFEKKLIPVLQKRIAVLLQ